MVCSETIARLFSLCSPMLKVPIPLSSALYSQRKSYTCIQITHLSATIYVHCRRDLPTASLYVACIGLGFARCWVSCSSSYQIVSSYRHHKHGALRRDKL